MNVKEISINNKFFPKQLINTKKVPQKLYVLGNEKILNSECFSIIGSRNCTDYGAQIARKFASELALKRSNNS